MCLSVVTQTYNPPLSCVKVGYKVLLKQCGKENTYATPVVVNQRMSLGESYIARNAHSDAYWTVGKIVDDMIVYNDSKYPYGFHLFDNKEDAKRYYANYTNSLYRVIEVEYDEVVATGIEEMRCDMHLSCVVAKRIKLVREVE